ncbi:unnamed protein product [Arabidopsis halleri]
MPKLEMLGEEMSEMSEGGSSSTTRGKSSVLEDGGFECDCGKAALVRQSWTDANPGRRFCRCGAGWKNICNYFRWLDLEKPHEQTEELTRLRAIVGGQEERNTKDEGRELLRRLEDLEKENMALRSYVKASSAKDQTIRQVVIISWIGFACVVATIVHALK